MVDEKRKRSILNQLTLPQKGSKMKANLPSSLLQQDEILPFIRKIERILSEQDRCESLITYWSSADASWLMPERADLFALSQTVSAITRFSEDRQEQLDEFCFACVSGELAVLIYGCGTESEADGFAYECAGSLDAATVKRAIDAMSPYLEFIDPLDANKLHATLSRVGSAQTMPHFVNSLQHYWSELNLPVQVQTNNKPEEKVAAAATRSEDAQWARISNSYPYPIANPYRALESITNPAEKYKEQLKLIENLLALLAGICLSISAQNERKILADLKEYVSHGVSMGHWREIIRKCASAWKTSSTKDIPLAKSIIGLRIEQTASPGFGKAVEQLIIARNDFAHHRGPTAESQIEKETERLGALLDECIKLTEFLCDHPIRIVKAIDVLPSGVIKMVCLKAVGDHPVLRQEELCLSRGFPKGQLILDTGESNWLSLYPFLTQDICSSCGTMEIYHLDKWRYEKDRLQVRSFERGHAQESNAISQVLKAIVPVVP